VTVRAEPQPLATPASPPQRKPRELSMRVLEFALAFGAFATAILLGLAR